MLCSCTRRVPSNPTCSGTQHVHHWHTTVLRLLFPRCLPCACPLFCASAGSGVVSLEINNPKANALSFKLIEEVRPHTYSLPGYLFNCACLLLLRVLILLLHTRSSCGECCGTVFLAHPHSRQVRAGAAPVPCDPCVKTARRAFTAAVVV